MAETTSSAALVVRSASPVATPGTPLLNPPAAKRMPPVVNGLKSALVN
ncbi:MAG: hypothetical protein E7C36_12770 [Mixta calida]|nr:hypothetical protein [Mixta calida]MCR1567049.1 hypothetical protein [Mixta sp.]MDU3817376.1 hypothetical protein [Pantoea sp.]KAF0857898.1 hypothetical protein Y888_19425 [Mixta calida B021323]MDU2734136.1 hypothetical protein [Mixta calida]MDU3076271.1 hypothetical protein [Mixta calida]